MSGMDTLDAIQASLIGAGLGQKSDSAEDWMIYKGAMPDSAPTGTPNKTVADRAICLYETPGREPLQGWAIVYPGLQVAVRGAPDDYTAVRNQIEKIWQQLDANEAPLGADFVYFYATHSGPLSGGTDQKRRPRLIWNFRSMRNTPSTA